MEPTVQPGNTEVDTNDERVNLTSITTTSQQYLNHPSKYRNNQYNC